MKLESAALLSGKGRYWFEMRSLKAQAGWAVPWDSREKCSEKMEGELDLKCLFFNYKCSSSKQLFLTAGHQLRRVTEVFRQEINKWDFFFFLARRNHYIMAVFLPSACQAFRNWQAFKTVRLFLDEGHSIKLSSSSRVVSNAWSPGGHPGKVNMGQDTSAPPPWELDVAFGRYILINQQP